MRKSTIEESKRQDIGMIGKMLMKKDQEIQKGDDFLFVFSVEIKNTISNRQNMKFWEKKLIDPNSVKFHNIKGF
jgi:hypothetical protein